MTWVEDATISEDVFNETSLKSMSRGGGAGRTCLMSVVFYVV